MAGHKGEDVHIHWHGPVGFPAFRRLIRRWLKAYRAVWRAGVCCTEIIGSSVGSALFGGDDHRANISRVLDYVLKGADPAARRELVIAHTEPGGELAGKRCGVSTNIGPAARPNIRFDSRIF